MAFVNTQSYKKNYVQDVYRDTVLKQYAHCVELGSKATDSEGLVQFEQAIEMLESCVCHRFTPTYQAEVGRLLAEKGRVLQMKDRNKFFQFLRLRFMLIVQELSFLGYMPEEKAINEE
jgi:hypothetical protein